jgi:hypothetical protein
MVRRAIVGPFGVSVSVVTATTRLVGGLAKAMMYR